MRIWRVAKVPHARYRPQSRPRHESLRARAPSSTISRSASWSARRSCLIGRNGAGKSTLFKLLSHEDTPDSGEVIVTQGLSVARLSQDPHFPAEATVRTALEWALADPPGPHPAPWRDPRSPECRLRPFHGGTAPCRAGAGGAPSAPHGLGHRAAAQGGPDHLGPGGTRDQGRKPLRGLAQARGPGPGLAQGSGRAGARRAHQPPGSRGRWRSWKLGSSTSTAHSCSSPTTAISWIPWWNACWSWREAASPATKAATAITSWRRRTGNSGNPA